MLKKISLLFILFFCISTYASENIIEDNIQINKKENEAGSINWAPYMKELELKIKKNWNPPKESYSNQIVVLFTIAKDGTLINKRIKTSSKIPLADKAAMDAIEKTSPFKPLPAEYKGTSLPVEYTFEYNVLSKDMHKKYRYTTQFNNTTGTTEIFLDFDKSKI